MSAVEGLSANYLQRFDFIDFALLFGSYAENRAHNLSDVDIGIFTNKDISLLEIGFLTANLESILKIKVDLMILNNLYKKNPVIAYEIVSSNKILFCINENKFIDFKKNALLYFMDTKNMRDMINKTFKDRLNKGKFGEHNFV